MDGQAQCTGRTGTPRPLSGRPAHVPGRATSEYLKTRLVVELAFKTHSGALILLSQVTIISARLKDL